jgi:hypothetical protein
LSAYQESTALYSAAVRELVHKTVIASRQEYERFNKIAEEKRLTSIGAKNKLDRHIAEHGC